MKHIILFACGLLLFNGFLNAQKPATKKSTTPSKTEPAKPPASKPATKPPAKTTPASEPRTPANNNAAKKTTPASTNKTVTAVPQSQTQHGINLELFRVTIALETGVPVLSMANSSIFTLGSSVHVNYMLSPKFCFGANLSFQWFAPKTTKSNSSYYRNAVAEASYIIKEKFHIDGSFGFARFYGTNKPNAIMPMGLDYDYAGICGCAGCGYYVGKHLDLSARFQMSLTVKFVGIRVAYRFLHAS